MTPREAARNHTDPTAHGEERNCGTKSLTVKWELKKKKRHLRGESEPRERAYLQVSVHDAHVVEIVHSIQDLSDERAGIFLRVEAFFHDSVKELAAGHPAQFKCVLIT